MCVMENDQIQRLLDVNPDPVFIAERKTGRIQFFNRVFGNTVNGGIDLSDNNLFEIAPKAPRG